MNLIDGWRQAWRLWSVRVSATGSLLMALALASPDALLAAWNVLPAEVTAFLPERVAQAIALALFMATIVARMIPQPAVLQPKTGAGNDR